MRTTIFNLDDGRVEFQQSEVPPWGDADEFGGTAAELYSSPTALAFYIAFPPGPRFQFIPVPIMRFARLSLGAASWSSQVVRRSIMRGLSCISLSPVRCTAGAMLLRTRCCWSVR